MRTFFEGLFTLFAVFMLIVFGMVGTLIIFLVQIIFYAVLIGIPCLFIYWIVELMI